MIARWLAIAAALALAVQTAAPAPAMAAAADHHAHAWCGLNAPPPEALAVLAEIAEIAGKTVPAEAPDAPGHDELCALRCAALGAPAALVAPTLAFEPAEFPVARRAWTALAEAAAPVSPDITPHRPRGPPLA